MTEFPGDDSTVDDSTVDETNGFDTEEQSLYDNIIKFFFHQPPTPEQQILHCKALFRSAAFAQKLAASFEREYVSLGCHGLTGGSEKDPPPQN